ncbi:hypothetical protein [Bacillus sp. FJAT-47783]|uniref:hypothetical protein n=1 Tax=Bacillus sp. FJAT-47783 TaxID=2922712 RepID=UPI001FAE3CB7|nr:hypothetical protein [Bacillus sp. FJAT-47783]
MIWIAVLLLTFVSFKELPPLFQKHRWKEITVFFLFTLINFVLALLIFLEIDVPNPQDAIYKFSTWLFPHQHDY